VCQATHPDASPLIRPGFDGDSGYWFPSPGRTGSLPA
jgi:hypothetical protein